MVINGLAPVVVFLASVPIAYLVAGRCKTLVDLAARRQSRGCRVDGARPSAEGRGIEPAS